MYVGLRKKPLFLTSLEVFLSTEYAYPVSLKKGLAISHPHCDINESQGIKLTGY